MISKIANVSSIGNTYIFNDNHKSADNHKKSNKSDYSEFSTVFDQELKKLDRSDYINESSK